MTPEPVAEYAFRTPCHWILLLQSCSNWKYSKIAAHLASAAPSGRSILVDAFAGAGGNTIAFAKTGRWKRVYAIEKDPVTLQCAKHNAKVYGVENKITWFEGDCFEILKNQLKDLGPYAIIFASPPWGGKLLLYDLSSLLAELSCSRKSS